jgi:hypothetical protein
MASTITNELIYEVLKSVQAQVALTREDIASIKARLTSLDMRLGGVHTDMALLSDRMDPLESRMGRVETRLNLTEASPGTFQLRCLVFNAFVDTSVYSRCGQGHMGKWGMQTVDLQDSPG